MISHPVPQNVTSYEFHLIGNMTLKQFLELAVGVVAALAVYGSNLYPIVKWPLVILFATLGAAFAFLPINERPLDTWFLAFIRAIYNPTKYYWRRKIVIPELFSYKPHAGTRSQANVAPEPQLASARISSYLETVSPDEDDQLIRAMDERARSIVDLYNIPFEDLVSQITQGSSANLELEPFTQISLDDLPAQPATNLEQIIEEPTTQEEVLTENTPQESHISVQIAPVNTEPIRITNPIQVFSRQEHRGTQVAQSRMAHIDQTEHIATPIESQEVTTNTNLPFPSKPTKPNLLVGMTLMPDGHIADNAIIEIQDEKGFPVRALRSNALGQFSISTPLPNGVYVLTAEKEGLSFATMKLELHGKIVDPIEVRASEA